GGPAGAPCARADRRSRARAGARAVLRERGARRRDAAAHAADRARAGRGAAAAARRARGGARANLTRRTGGAMRVLETRFFAVEQVALAGRREPVTLLRMPDWVMTVAIEEEGRFVLVRQHRFGIAAETIEPAGGLVDAGETPMAGGLRELLEETGYAGAVAEPLGATAPNPALQDNLCHLFLVRAAVRVAAPARFADEPVELVLWSRAEVEAGLSKGRFRHALAELALRRALAAL